MCLSRSWTKNGCISEEQVRSLLEWVREHAGANRSVYPFMRIVAEQALRPTEARALRVSDVALAEGDPGKLTARHKGMAREIPLQPQFVEFLREWISAAGLQEDDLLLPGTRGGRLSASVWQRIWQQAQEAVLPRDELYSWRLGEPISILRESRLVKWLDMGISPITVAEWGGRNPELAGAALPALLPHGEGRNRLGHLAEVMALPDSPRS
ncbi:tyrosine-type recombinase/integrase [Streptomyces sp. NPDC006356]